MPLGSGSRITYSIPWEEVALALRDIRYGGPINFECGTWFGSFPKDLIPEAMALCVKAARPFARIVEGKA